MLRRSEISSMLSCSTRWLEWGSHFFAHVLLLIIHSLKSIASGMLSSAETPKVQADVSQNWVQ